MVDVNTQNKTISVNVSSSGVSSNVNASGDATMYYSNKAREWAISNRIVDGVDYSSKYYAGKSKQSALNAQSFAQSAQDSYNNFQQSVTDSLNTIDNKVQEATDNIEIQKQDTITEIQDIATTQKEEIESLSEQEQSKIVDLGIDTRANVDLNNLSTTGQAKFNAKVNKSGDTMTGTLTVEADGQYTRTIAMKSKTIDISTNASLTSNDGLYFVDKNGIAICWCVIQQENGTKNTALSVGYNASQNPNFLGFNFPKATTKATTVSTASAYKPAVVVQNYVNGTSWYRVWSDGWIEQGGRITGNHPTVTLLKNFSNTNYTAFAIQTGDGEYDSNIRVHTITTSGFTIYCNNYTGEKIWYACGY